MRSFVCVRGDGYAQNAIIGRVRLRNVEIVLFTTTLVASELNLDSLERSTGARL